MLSIEEILSDQLTNFLHVPQTSIVRSAPLPNILSLKESLIITGVRRCGKSFLMKLIAQSLIDRAAIGYIDLDDPRLAGADNSIFEQAHGFWLKNRAAPERPLVIFIDEPQNIDGWELWVDYFAKQVGHHVVLTGSNSTMLSSDLSTHLTGRHRELYLTPLSFPEIVKSSGIGAGTHIEQHAMHQRTLDTYMQFGGFPRAHLDRDRSILAQYFKDIIYKDIAPRRKGASAKSLLELGVTIMSNNTRLVNKSRLTRSLGYKQARTITSYLGAFEDSYVFREVKRFDSALRRQQRSIPKFYAIDPAMASTVGFRVLGDKSSSLENLVQLELIRRGYETFYWTDPVNGWEIDFIARKFGAETIAVQVCFDLSNEEVLHREARGLESLRQHLGIQSLLVITYDRPAKESAKLIPPGVDVMSFVDWAMLPSGPLVAGS